MPKLPSASTPVASQATPHSASTYTTTHNNLDQFNPSASANNFYILSIDGGGARGMIPAVILKEIERRTGKRIAHLFDRVCGSSTGSILACGLTAPKVVGQKEPKFKAADIVEIYRTLGKEIFSRGSFASTVQAPLDDLKARVMDFADAGNLGTYVATHIGDTVALIEAARKVPDLLARLNSPLHDVHKLAFHLYTHLGNLKLEDALTEMFVYAYDIGSRTPEVLGSRASKLSARNYRNYRMYQAATASSAAVPFFGPYKVYRDPQFPVVAGPGSPMPELFPEMKGDGDMYELVDGGNGGLANPSLFAALEDTPASAGKTKIILSLGTGHATEPIDAKTAQGGFFQWLGEGALLNCLFDGESDAVDRAMYHLYEKSVGVFRWQPEIPKTLAFMDEGSEADMGALEDMAQAFIADNDKEIDEFIKILTLPQFEHV
jgi:uncharacterized protein